MTFSGRIKVFFYHYLLLTLIKYILSELLPMTKKSLLESLWKSLTENPVYIGFVYSQTINVYRTTFTDSFYSEKGLCVLLKCPDK